MQRIQIENRSDLKSEIPLSTPYCIFIDPSSACNFKCKFCMNQRITHPSVMQFSLFKKLIDDLSEFESKVKTIRLYGLGEPLLNPKFCDMVRYAKKSSKVLAVDTTTNASLLTSDMIINLVASGLDRINISITAMDTADYRDFTRNEYVHFEGILDSITLLFKNKPKSMTVFVKIDGDYINAYQRQQFLEIFTPISDGRAIEHTMNCWRDFEVADVNQEVGIYGQPLENVDVCPYIFYSFMVHADGYASACFLDWNKKLVIGDAKNESLKSLWNDRALNAFRKMMLTKHRKEHTICGACAQLKAGMPVNLDPYAEDLLKRVGGQ